MPGLKVPIEFNVQVTASRNPNDDTTIFTASVTIPNAIHRHAKLNDQDIIYLLEAAVSNVRINVE